MNQARIRKYIGISLLFLGVAIASYGLGKHYTHMYCWKIYNARVIPFVSTEEFKKKNGEKVAEAFGLFGASLTGYPTHYPGGVLRKFCGSGIVIFISGLLLVFYEQLPSTDKILSFRLYKKDKKS
jgi:hypothetical protein